jgi:hypothetical protein
MRGVSVLASSMAIALARSAGFRYAIMMAEAFGKVRGALEECNKERRRAFSFLD